MRGGDNIIVVVVLYFTVINGDYDDGGGNDGVSIMIYLIPVVPCLNLRKKIQSPILQTCIKTFRQTEIVVSVHPIHPRKDFSQRPPNHNSEILTWIKIG